jgi:cytochrome c553
MVGVASASPGKQLLGTVPVEEDGSAFFEAPAKTPILFQALDENGRMVQGMRSLVYLQPGEAASCVGCHEDRTTAVPSVKTIASTKKPAQIVPGPDGSKPLSFPILVQPVLDRACVSCHNAEKAEGGFDLTGTPTERYTKAYEALTPLVPYTAWGNPEGNYEPRTEPDRFGSRPSKLTKLILNGHYDVKLTPEEWERLNVWQDLNALFYGTFNPADQARQQRGERIEGPDLE